jgi:small subunit ribosomal protein S6
MANPKKNYYETMFLISQAAAADFGAAIEHIRGLFKRIDAEIIALSKWDERRLAFEIKKQRRGIYILSYFACDPLKVAELERACNLSDQILRFMTVKAEHMTIEEMQAADDQQGLADEAKLRDQQAVESAKRTSSAKSRAEIEEEANAANADDAPEVEPAEEETAPAEA